MERQYQICTRCIMDTSNVDIEFDEDGICNHCREYETFTKKFIYTGGQGELRLRELIADIKSKGRGKKYDCVVGVSGGVDSTYAVFLAHHLGLRPLAVVVDNGYDTEIAKTNVEKTLKKLNVDLYTCVLDEDEYRDLQLSFLQASVIDIEMVTDHAIWATLFNTASKGGIKYILAGTNMATKSIRIDSWGFPKTDLSNLRDIHNKFGTIKLKTFPTISLLKHGYYQYIKGIRLVSILNYIPYVADEVKEIITRELGWQDYGGKYRESIFTRFYQAYILPRKFGIDKRRAHLSNLIHAGQLSREQAVKEMSKPLYTDGEFKKDKDYCLKKLGLTEAEFEELMELPIRSHYDYKSDALWRGIGMRVHRLLGGWA